MEWLLYAVLFVWSVMQLTFVSYLAVMNAVRNRPLISKPAWVFIAPMAAVGITLDVLLNVIVATVLFLDIPRELLFTSRLHRYRDNVKYDGKRRQKAAAYVCEKLLNAFDPSGKHC